MCEIKINLININFYLYFLLWNWLAESQANLL